MTTTKEKAKETREMMPVTSAFTTLFAGLIVGISYLEEEATKIVNDVIKEVEDIFNEDAQV